MASEIKANKLSPATGTALTIGDSGDSVTANALVNIASDSVPLSINSTNSNDYKAALKNAGTATGYLGSNSSAPLLVADSSVSELMRVDSNGNVGIGTSNGTTTVSSGLAINNATAGNYPGLEIQTAGVTRMFFNANNAESYISSVGTNPMAFYTNGVERMRIDSAGNVGIGALGGSSIKFRSYQPSTNSYAAAFSGNNYNILSELDSTAGYQIVFSTTNYGTSAGTIYSSGSTTSYNTSSDYRLKENVQPLTGGIDRLKQLKPSHWTWVQNGEYGEGFVAHEAQQVVPLSVTGTKDAMRTEEYEITPAVFNDEGVETAAAVMGTREVPDYQGIDQSKLVPLLTSALQEAVAMIESLEARVAALEAN